MDILANAYTDVGSIKKINQDSACLKVAQTLLGTITMAVVCDGVGGLYKGELASATVVREFNAWFDQKLPQMLERIILQEKRNNWKNIIKEIKENWKAMLNAINSKMVLYGQERNQKVGTTISACLILDQYCYLAVHIGDSRIYLLRDGIKQITKDHTVTEREVMLGRLSRAEAEVDPRRHVLLQCMGAVNTVEPDVIIDEVKQNDVFLLCTDGFYNTIQDKELFLNFNASRITSQEEIGAILQSVSEETKARGETDNITGVILKII